MYLSERVNRVRRPTLRVHSVWLTFAATIWCQNGECGFIYSQNDQDAVGAALLKTQLTAFILGIGKTNLPTITVVFICSFCFWRELEKQSLWDPKNSSWPSVCCQRVAPVNDLLSGGGANWVAAKWICWWAHILPTTPAGAHCFAETVIDSSSGRVVYIRRTIDEFVTRSAVAVWDECHMVGGGEGGVPVGAGQPRRIFPTCVSVKVC